ncbi:hypothetical protein HQ584_12560, partial [Patescibacteria group bacterium]|nr:hypothetical protein [Patescibacteria group bacterium]
PIKIRIGKIRDFYWVTIKTGEKIDLPRRKGKSLGLSNIKTTEGKIGNKIVETKQISVPQKGAQNDFFKELCSIKGIGIKTAKDIIRIFPKSEDLKNKLHNGDTNELPIRDDLAILLEEKYG